MAPSENKVSFLSALVAIFIALNVIAFSWSQWSSNDPVDLPQLPEALVTFAVDVSEVSGHSEFSCIDVSAKTLVHFFQCIGVSVVEDQIMTQTSKLVPPKSQGPPVSELA